MIIFTMLQDFFNLNHFSFILSSKPKMSIPTSCWGVTGSSRSGRSQAKIYKESMTLNCLQHLVEDSNQRTLVGVGMCSSRKYPYLYHGRNVFLFVWEFQLSFFNFLVVQKPHPLEIPIPSGWGGGGKGKYGYLHVPEHCAIKN